MNEKRARKYSFSGFPIVDAAGGLVGIITARDIKFLTDYRIKIRDVMTKKPVIARDGVSMQEAYRIMLENKVGKLPMVDANGRLTGLYSFLDVKTLISKEEPITTATTITSSVPPPESVLMISSAPRRWSMPASTFSCSTRPTAIRRASSRR